MAGHLWSKPGSGPEGAVRAKTQGCTTVSAVQDQLCSHKGHYVLLLVK